MVALMPYQPVLWREVGRRLRLLREAKGLTVAEAARELKVTAVQVQRIEEGLTSTTVEVVWSMMYAYGCHGDELLELVHAAVKPGWWESFRGSFPYEDYVVWEDGAATVSVLARRGVPDLLQTQDYARAALTGQFDHLHVQHLLREHVRRGMEMLTRRQTHITGTSRPRLFVVITEAALRRQVGNADTMWGQLLELRFANDIESVTFQVLRAGSAVKPRGKTGFRFLEFGHEEDPPRLYRPATRPSGLPRQRQVMSPGQVENARQQFDRLREASLSPEQSAEFIDSLLG